MPKSRRKESEKGTEEGIKRRRAEATSKETLGDLEESEKISNTKESSQVPSPDGQVDERDHPAHRAQVSNP